MYTRSGLAKENCKKNPKAWNESKEMHPTRHLMSESELFWVIPGIRLFQVISSLQLVFLVSHYWSTPWTYAILCINMRHTRPCLV